MSNHGYGRPPPEPPNYHQLGETHSQRPVERTSKNSAESVKKSTMTLSSSHRYGMTTTTDSYHTSLQQATMAEATDERKPSAVVDERRLDFKVRFETPKEDNQTINIAKLHACALEALCTLQDQHTVR